MKTITVEDDIWKKLNKIKYDMNIPSISDVIEKLLNITRKIENARTKT